MATKPSLEQLLEGIDPSRLSQPCKDHHLSEVALHITEWQSIAPFLRLTEVDDKEIRTKFPQELIVQNTAMLRRWREKRGHKATYQELAKVFWKLGKLSLVEVVCEVLKSEWSSSESEGESEKGCVERSGSQRWTVPRYASYLKGRYRTTRPPVLSLQWLPPPTRTVFNLALIQKERLEFGPNEELVRLLQRGQVKEAAESQTEIELSNLMRADDEVRKVILIEGAPGSGKSTLAWHICQQWEKGELFTEYEVVVFVQLRDLELQSAKRVAEIFPVECRDMAPDIASLLTMSGRWGKGVLLVLDGWDELQPDCLLHSLLMQLIVSPVHLSMHFSSVIVTSRPVSSGELQPHASSRIEVLGFKPQEVQEYFRTCFGRDHQLHTMFVAQLRERRVIEASCFLPLNAVIVVYTFRACNHSLPHTLHGVFEKLVLSCIVRHITDRGEAKGGITASCLSDLPPDIEATLLTLASLAYYGIWVNKVVFSEIDLKVFNLPADLSSTLSLVQVVENFRVCGGRFMSYNFFHLQIQELLAAYHISKLKEGEQVRVFKDLFGQPRFAAVFQFYAAFTKLQAKGVRDVLVDMIKNREYYKAFLQCIYEAQDPSLCQLFAYALYTKHASFVVTSHSDSLYIIALGYFLCHYCYYCPEELSVTIDDVTIRPFVKEFLQHQSHITAASPYNVATGSFRFTLTLSRNLYWEAFVQCASELLSSLKPLITGLVFKAQNSTLCAKLSTDMNTFSTLVQRSSFLQDLEFQCACSTKGVVTVTELDLLQFVTSIQSNKQLRSFSLRRIIVQISQFSLAAVFRAIATNSTIKYLTLNDCQFDLTGQGIPQLHAIPLSNHLKVIDLSGTSLVGCVSPLLKGISSNTSIVELILEDCAMNLTRDSGQELTVMLRTNKTLRALNLRGNYEIVEGKKICTQAVDLQSICVGLSLNTSLAYLDLSMCQLAVTEDSGPALANVLQTNTTLKSLKLDGNDGISNEGAVYLAQGLAQNRGLETLSIVECGISTAVVELAEALKANKCLLSLDMSRNDVGERFVHIVRNLQVNSTLRHLRTSVCDVKHIVLLDIAGASLESLDLSANPIGDEGAAHIAQLLTKSNSLYQLNLERCGIGGKGAECLASALEVNTSLEILHIAWNNIHDTGLLALGRSLKRNKALKTLNMAGCGTRIGQQQFVLCLCENEYLTYLGLFPFHNVKHEISEVNKIRQEKKRSMLSLFF